MMTLKESSTWSTWAERTRMGRVVRSISLKSNEKNVDASGGFCTRLTGEYSAFPWHTTLHNTEHCLAT
jgi:hypothetical protein